MTPEEFERERRKSAEALGRVAEGAARAAEPRTPENVLGPPASVSSGSGEAQQGLPLPKWNPPSPPNLRPVNESWTAGGGEKNREAQVKFNSDQVQLDNALVAWTAEHFAATHRHYDGILDSMQRRMDDIDTRHRELERELVRHVHDMARRIDVVLGEGEKGRVSHEAALRSLRERLRVLEEKLG